MKEATVAALLVGVIVASAGSGYFIGGTSQHTVTSTTTSTETSTTTQSVSQASTYPLLFIFVTDSGNCMGAGEYVPCFGYPAHVFNACPNLVAGPATSWTCSYTVRDPMPPHHSFKVNVTMGVRDQPGEPTWANCFLVDAANTSSYLECLPVINSTAFIIGERYRPFL